MDTTQTCDSTQPKHAGQCPLQELLSRLGDKWSMLVIMALAKSDTHCLRFSDLRKNVHGISQRMLTTTLRYLERDGIISRHPYPEIPPRVEYCLTERGKSLLSPVKSFCQWVEKNWMDINASRNDYDTAIEKRKDF